MALAPVQFEAAHHPCRRPRRSEHRRNDFDEIGIVLDIRHQEFDVRVGRRVVHAPQQFSRKRRRVRGMFLNVRNDDFNCRLEWFIDDRLRWERRCRV